ncbi:RagB/SusD family nutrient uptake outer membrane protein [Ochrovirga pacifica]|uniref:RagB/SusD family nutrient uptake outer membrane protein n=1 Tax=Ochrovirga pacifica TaxID=1042376 RepID=UPI0004966D9C|nr:RagB/SusD family nutrient uptake outer membrane protein [Ochrovirga pacifica]
MKTIKKIIHIKLAVLSMLALTFTSCQDDFLEQENPNAPSTSTFWKTLEDLEYGLIGAYKNFGSTQNIRLIDDMSCSDLAWASGWQRPTNSNEYYLQIFNEASDAVNRKWHQNYRTIFSANQVIAACEKLIGTFNSEVEEERANQILAEARFIRGYMYFLLHNAYNEGAVVIKDKPSESEEDYSSPLQSAEKVKEFLLADLDFASKNLPISWANGHRGRVTAGAAVALMGQTAMYHGDFATAAEYFKRVINDYGYALTPDIGSNFTTRDELNEESIIEVVYSMDFKNNLGPWDSRDVANTSYHKRLTGVNGWWGAVAANWLILEYRNDAIDTADPRNVIITENPDGTTSQRFRSFSPRTSQSVALVDELDTPYYKNSNPEKGDLPGQVTNFNVKMTCFWRKHTNWDLGAVNEDALSPGKVRSGINERLLRLAEIYLQYAECQIELGNMDEAMKFINRVRRRAGVVLLGPVGTGEYPNNDHDNITYTPQTLMEHLRLKEYPLELSCEGDGDRNIDLRRWAKYGNYAIEDFKKKRFEELASRRYDALDHEVIMKDGTKVTRWGSIVVEVPENDPEVDVTWNEFQRAAENYNQTKAYWPVPNSEIIANGNLYNDIPADE